MKFFKILKFLILLFLVSCNDSNNKPIEDVNPDSTISLEKNNENETYPADHQYYFLHSKFLIHLCHGAG